MTLVISRFSAVPSLWAVARAASDAGSLLPIRLPDGNRLSWRRRSRPAGERYEGHHVTLFGIGLGCLGQAVLLQPRTA
jgi:hypothetical protein